MMNKNGFTLVELLATISILAILATVSIVAINSTMNRAEDNTNKIQEEMFIDSAKAYVADHLNEFKTCSSGCNITISKLIDEGYLDEGKIDSTTKNKKVKVVTNGTSTSKKYTYELIDP